MSNKKENNKLIRWISEWGLFAIATLILVSYTALTVQPNSNEKQGIWVNLLFLVLNLLAAFYISSKVSLWGWQTDNANNQKKIAKTAIRHTRGNLASILKLIKIIKEKVDLVEDPLTKQYLKEIKNHLEILYNGIRNSEVDFNEIVNEELKEQNILEVEISELFTEIEQKNQELIEKEGQQQADKKTIGQLKQTIKEKEAEINYKVSSLPFGSSPFFTGSGLNLFESKKGDLFYNNDTFDFLSNINNFGSKGEK